MNGYTIGVLKEAYEDIMAERNRICSVINECGGNAVNDNIFALRKLDENRNDLLSSIRIVENEKNFLDRQEKERKRKK